MTTNPEPDADQTDRRDRYAAALHAQMPGCTHDEHGDDCRALTAAVMAVADTEHAELKRALMQAQAEVHQYRTALQGVARREAAVPSVGGARTLHDTADRGAWLAAAAFVEAMNEGCGRKPCNACTTREDVADALRDTARRLAAEWVRDTADRSRLLLWAADRLERMPGYPRLVLPEELLTELRRLAAEQPTNTEAGVAR